MPWTAFVFGWPFVMLAAAAFIASMLSTPSSSLGVVGAVLAAPFCLLISGSPARIPHYGGLTALLANFVAAWLLYKRQRVYGLAFLIPFLALAIFVAIAVARQPIQIP